MSELMYQMDEIARRAAKERERKPDLWSRVAEIALAFILAGILDLICC